MNMYIARRRRRNRLRIRRRDEGEEEEEEEEEEKPVAKLGCSGAAAPIGDEVL